MDILLLFFLFFLFSFSFFPSSLLLSSLCFVPQKQFFHSTLSPVSCSVVCDAFDRGELGTQQQHNTTKTRPPCLSVCPSFQRETRLRSQRQTQEKERKKKKKNETETKTKQRKSSTQQIQIFFLQWSNALSFFLSFFRDLLLLSPPPTPR